MECSTPSGLSLVLAIQDDMSHARNCDLNIDTYADSLTNQTPPELPLDHETQLTGSWVHRCWRRLTRRRLPSFLQIQLPIPFKSLGSPLVLHETHHRGRPNAGDRDTAASRSVVSVLVNGHRALPYHPERALCSLHHGHGKEYLKVAITPLRTPASGAS